MAVAWIGKLWKNCLLTWGKAVVELFYPRICVVCEKSLVRGEEYLCSVCLADFPFSDEAYSTQTNVLMHIDESYRPEMLFSLYYYNKHSPYKQLIYRVKYLSHRVLGRRLGRMLGEKMRGHCHADCIVPVPLHPKREKTRGFNQAAEIAKGIADVLHIPVFEDVICRVRNNVSQTGKNAAERLENVENLFEMRCAQKIRGRHVLLVDDVITTGATIGACLRVLSHAEDVRFSLGCLAQTV